MGEGAENRVSHVGRESLSRGTSPPRRERNRERERETAVPPPPPEAFDPTVHYQFNVFALSTARIVVRINCDFGARVPRSLRSICFAHVTR